ncbi:RDD family protein [Falsirhodobacter halotolerans]|uniref:RDD family protein n=1 Tax=Falsirhodobacter halotolerans TaxID=1146892 RepID=UPI001FD07B1A|nr:RDD family protein [Falsirhodobacter halotolerans]MCJ8139230.1 RDD family protein [Falsirhodobacter halotolerans]
MTAAPMMDALPDPDLHAEFYDGVVTKRFLAWLIDITFIFVLTLIALPFTLFIGLLFYPILFVTVGVLYRWWSLARKSATPGMRICGIHFLNRDGDPLGPVEAALHVAGYVLSMGTFLVQVLSIGLMLMTPRRQGLTDLAMGTVAINRAA